MNQTQKKTFIRELVASIQREAISKVASMPENWDGIELRWYMADKFEASTLNFAHDRVRQARKRAYNNEVIVRNL